MSGLPDGVAHGIDGGGRATIVLTRGAERVEIACCGAQVLTWRDATGEVLWTASHSTYEPGKAVRGGVPVVFPWFGAYTLGGRAGEGLPPHGFARDRDWRVAALRDGPVAVFELQDDAASRAIWPHSFRTQVEVGLDAGTAGGLRISMQVENTGSEPFVYEQALHTYFCVGDVRTAEIRGLEGVAFAEHAALPEVAWPADAPMRFRAETDRVFQDTPPTIELRTPTLSRTVQLTTEHAETAIVWNPWIEKTKRLSQMAIDDWQTFCCIETANARERARQLAPGARHTMTLRLTTSAHS